VLPPILDQRPAGVNRRLLVRTAFLLYSGEQLNTLAMSALALRAEPWRIPGEGGEMPPVIHTSGMANDGEEHPGGASQGNVDSARVELWTDLTLNVSRFGLCLTRAFCIPKEVTQW